MSFDPLTYRAGKPPIGHVLGASGDEYPIPHPMLWPDGTQEATNDGRFGEAVAGILGEDAYADFCRRGGTAAMLMEHIGELLGDGRGVTTVGESAASES